MKYNETSHYNLEDELLLTNIRNQIYAITIYDVLHLKVLIDSLDSAFEGMYFYDFEDVERNFIFSKKLYQLLSKQERKQKGITDDLIKYKACAYHLYKKIKNTAVVDESNANLMSKINNTLQTFNNITNRCDLKSETLHKVLSDKLYNNMKYANLITEEELEKLVN